VPAGTLADHVASLVDRWGREHCGACGLSSVGAVVGAALGSPFPPTVYIGSYDGNLYAFDARSGAVRWTHSAGGKISGSSTIVGRVVYYSRLGNHDKIGLNVSSGNRVWRYPFGAFNPVISDGQRVYLTLNSNVVGLLPKPKGKPKPKPPPKKKQQQKKKPPQKKGPQKKH